MPLPVIGFVIIMSFSGPNQTLKPPNVYIIMTHNSARYNGRDHYLAITHQKHYIKIIRKHSHQYKTERNKKQTK